MQRQWYGDRRDLLKWTVVAELAERGVAKRMLYVSFLREGEQEPPVHPIVWEHFRGIDNLEELANNLDLDFEMIEASFDPRSRSEYIACVMEWFQRSDTRRCVVLLDPDTGVAPKKVSSKHVTKNELCTIWDELKSGDWLLIYQHRWRDRQWREKAETGLLELLPGAHVKSEYRDGIVTDAAILVARKK